MPGDTADPAIPNVIARWAQPAAAIQLDRFVVPPSGTSRDDK
jgi:hypothetical protein